MSIWGKIAGVAAGYAIGGVPGAVFGALAGHFVLDRINDRQVIFTIALISLAAKMTRADGIVSPIEVQAVQSVLRVPETEHANMVRVFRLAQEDVAGFDTYARQIRDIYADSPQVLEDVLDVLFYIAYADGNLHPAEEEFFCTLSRRFSKLTKAAYAACRRAMMVRFKTRMWCWAWHRQAVMRLCALPGWSWCAPIIPTSCRRAACRRK